MTNLYIYIKSEAFILDILIFFFTFLLGNIMPTSTEEIIKMFGSHKLLSICLIQFLIAIIVGRVIKRFKIKGKNTLLILLISGFVFFLWLMPTVLYNLSDDSSSVIPFGFITGIFTLLFGIMLGVGIENWHNNIKTKASEIILFIADVITNTFPFFALIIFQILYLSQFTNLSIIDIILYLILTGILPFRILIAIQKPRNFFGISLGFIVIVLDIWNIFITQ